MSLAFCRGSWGQHNSCPCLLRLSLDMRGSLVCTYAFLFFGTSSQLLFLWHYYGPFYLQKTIATHILVSLNFKLTWQTYGAFRSTMCPTCLSTVFLSSLWRVSPLSGWEGWVAIKEVKGQEGTCLALTGNIYRQHRQPGHCVLTDKQIQNTEMWK